MCELKSLEWRQGGVGLCHTLTGVWVEMWSSGTNIYFILSHPHGCVSWNMYLVIYRDTFSCHTLTGVWVEIQNKIHHFHLPSSHTLTGVWVEMIFTGRMCITNGHTLTGVWVEMLYLLYSECLLLRHTLTGVWVEICATCSWVKSASVTPSRVCELKYRAAETVTKGWLSHPHGCVSWNFTRFSS